MSRGRRFDETPRLNKKKVAATIIAVIVFIMIIISLKKILSGEVADTKFISGEAYFPVYENGSWSVINSSGAKLENISSDEMILVPDNTKDIFIVTYDTDYDNETYKTKVLNKKGNEIFTNYNNVEPLINSNESTSWYEANVLRFEKNGKYGLLYEVGDSISLANKMQNMLSNVELYNGFKTQSRSRVEDINKEATIKEFSTLKIMSCNDIKNKKEVMRYEKVKN